MAGKLSAFFGAQDMTQGSPGRNLVLFSLPLLLGNLAQQLYSTVDSIVVGRNVGVAGLAAIGASMPVLNLLLVLFMGISVGASIMVSQLFGARETEKLSHTVGTAVTATLVACLIIMTAGPLLAPWLLELLDTPSNVYQMACDYLTILFIGVLGSAYYNIISGILRGLGDSIMPLVFLVVACGLNTGLDILFVKYFNWGVPGAAWATIISQAISGALCLIKLFSMRGVLHVKLKTLWPKKALLGQLIRLGLPSGLTQAIFSLAMIVVQALTNSFGDLVMAANTAVMRVDGFAMMPNFTFGTAMTTFVGQNIGAGRMDRVGKGVRSGLKLSLSVSVVLVGLILLFGRTMLGFFIDDVPQVIELGQRMMFTLALGYVAMAVTQVLSGTMRGAGDTVTPMWISIITTVIIRVPVAYGLEYLTRPAGGVMGSGEPDCLFFSLLISWVLGAVITSVAYRMGRWKKKSIIKEEEGQ